MSQVHTMDQISIDRHGAVRLWFRVFLFLLCFVILWGVWVRLTGSGLSIPDWPLVNGKFAPPLSAADWKVAYDRYYSSILGDHSPSGPGLPMSKFKFMFAIEYFHRLVAAIVGLLFLVLFIFVLATRWRRQAAGYHMFIALLLLILQVFLGGLVVREELKAWLVAVHLGVAYLFLGFSLWSYLALHNAVSIRDSGSGRRWHASWSWIALGSLFIQIVSGGLMAGSRAGFILNTFPRMGDVWVPPTGALFSERYGGLILNLISNPVLIQLIHRWWPVVLLLSFGLLHLSRPGRYLTAGGRMAMRLATILLVAQIIVGIGNLAMKVPVYMSMGHSAIGMALFISMVAICREASVANKE